MHWRPQLLCGSEVWEREPYGQEIRKLRNGWFSDRGTKKNNKRLFGRERLGQHLDSVNGLGNTMNRCLRTENPWVFKKKKSQSLQITLSNRKRTLRSAPRDTQLLVLPLCPKFLVCLFSSSPINHNTYGDIQARCFPSSQFPCLLETTQHTREGADQEERSDTILTLRSMSSEQIVIWLGQWGALETSP